MRRAARDPTRPMRVPPRPAGEPPAPQRRRFHVPTSVILTLVGGVLTVLILPAVTRQWDDRQRAREIKAALIQEMATATSHAVGDSLALGLTAEEERKSSTDVTYAGYFTNDWYTANTKIRATLATYFPQFLKQWQRHTDAVTEARFLLSSVDLAGRRTKFSSVSIQGNLRLISHLYHPLTQLSPEEAAAPVPPQPVGDLIPDLAPEFRISAVALSQREPSALAQFAEAIIGHQQAIAEDVLSASPAGFSTTRKDLIRDILPGI
jgi:hypothetical protein